MWEEHGLKMTNNDEGQVRHPQTPNTYNLTIICLSFQCWLAPPSWGTTQTWDRRGNALYGWTLEVTRLISATP